MAVAAANVTPRRIYKVPLRPGGELLFKSGGYLEPWKVPDNFIVLSPDEDKHGSPKSDAGSSQWNVDSGPTSRSGSTPASSSDGTPNSITDELTNVLDPNEVRQLLRPQYAR